MHIDFRAHDIHEHGPTIEQRLTEARVDLQMAQRLREKMREQGMRIPLTHAEEDALFDEADRRFREQS